MEQDMLTNDITFCVSEATRSDVLAYFPALAPETVQAVPLAACTAPADRNDPTIERVERYILVLGTIEPRKNATQVLRYIQTHPEFTKRYRVVFLGRFGWGKTIEELLEAYQLQEQYRAGRIVFPGFVTEDVKSLLIKHASVLVYPSLFEGFGLPVLEAAAFGVPSVTTKSSSLPEVGGTHAFYFDPFNPSDFGRVLMKALIDAEVKGSAVRNDCLEWSKRFSWTKTHAIMKARISELFTKRVEH
jgi:glycosyltransferase involved in cell wall biosynthesis